MASKRLRIKRSKAAVARMMSAGEWLRIDEPNEGLDCYANRSNEHVLIVHFDGTGVEFLERHDFEAFMASLKATPRQRHVLHGTPGLDKQFTSRISEWITWLEGELGLPAGTLDASIESLGRLDEALNQRQASNRNKFFAPLTAYVGEVVRRVTGGRWVMHDAGEICEPWIRSGNEWYKPFSVVHSAFKVATHGWALAELMDAEYPDMVGGPGPQVS